MLNKNHLSNLATVCMFAILLAACGGRSGSGGDRSGLNTANTIIGGTVTELVIPLVLQNNGGDNLTLTAAGSFAFSTKVAAGTHYAVTVLTQPASQTCTVSNGSGTAGDQVSDIRVNCSVFVIATAPSRESTDIARNSAVSARFSSSIKPETLTNSSFSVSGVPGAVSMSADRRSAIFTPTSALVANTRYTAIIEKTVQDNNNNNLDSRFTWSFTTGAVSDNTAPLVSDKTPASGDTNVPTNSVVLVSFSEAMNPATLTTATFTIKDVNNNTVSGSVVTSADNRSASFTPTAALAANTNHTVTLSTGIQDIASNSLASNNTWT